MRTDAKVGDLAGRQSGLVTRQQLIGLGMTSAAVGRRVVSGRLIPLHPGVYALGHTALRREAWWRAAVWSCGPQTCLSFHQGAALLGQWEEPPGEPIHVTTIGGARSTPGRVVHRVSKLMKADVTKRHGIAVTSPARTLVDLSTVLPYPRFRALVDAQRSVDVAALVDAAARLGGSAALTRLLANDGVHTKSAFERRYVRWCRAAGLPTPDGRNVFVGSDKVDVLHTDAQLVVELDGRAHHERRSQMSADRKRDQRLQLHGLRVVRLVWEDLDAEFGAATTTTLRAFLASHRLASVDR